ncbi:MAG: ABC transporter ATP-binding protein [Firmicutes bacterium]|jgi:ABC-2 type transport system ATP-binding protein|nr:ABC transporter ATP-binding protein [Bacillota bacterium]
MADTQAQVAVEVIDLKKYYGSVKAVDGVSFYCLRGQVFTLLGPNGAGKTTIVEILEGLRQADSGQIIFLGKPCRTIGREEKERIGVLLQQTNWLPKLKVREMLEMFASFYRRSLKADELLEVCSLTDKAGALVETLSGGQRQRLAIGLALVNDPEVIFLDEPTTGLDPQARRNIWDLIETLKEQGKTIFLTTHYMDEAEQLSDFVYIMDQGKIIAKGTPQSLVDNLGQENVIEFSRGGFGPEQLQELEQMDGLRVGAEKVAVYTKDLTGDLTRIVEWAKQQGMAIEHLAVRRPNLEDVFLTLTGKGLRD